MITEDPIERARHAFERAVYSGDTGGLDDAEQALTTLEADAALARGRLLHARVQSASGAEDPAELPLFERALELYRSAGDRRGEGEAEFWIGCVHQFIRRDDETALPHLERSYRLATETGDDRTRAEASRHLGIAAHAAGRLDEARDRLEESCRLRRAIGNLPGVAANLVGLAYVAVAGGDRTLAAAHLDEAEGIASTHGADAVLRHVEQARAAL